MDFSDSHGASAQAAKGNEVPKKKSVVGFHFFGGLCAEMLINELQLGAVAGCDCQGQRRTLGFWGLLGRGDHGEPMSVVLFESELDLGLLLLVF